MKSSKILIVEDEVVVRMDIQEKLENTGYEVVGAVSTGESAIESAKKFKPDLVLMDIQLESEMDGIEAANQIRSQFDIPVVFVTAYADDKTLERAKITVPYGYIIKPIEERELQVAAEIALYKHKTEQQLHLLKKYETISLLAGGIAHVYNNLLTTINGYCSWILNEESLNSGIKNKLEKIYKAGENGSKLTQQLLAYSERQLMMPMKIDVNNFIFNQIEILREIISEDIEILFPHSVDGGSINADPKQLQEVVFNLVMNAKDAIEDKKSSGKIFVETKYVELKEDDVLSYEGCKPGKFIEISIRDNGIGINENTIKKIFDPFFTTKEIKNRIGLSLAAVYGIARQNNGFIDVSSIEGEGSTFSVYWPALEFEIIKQKGKKNEAIKRGHKDETLLVVDDTADIRNFLQYCLEDIGYNILMAKTRDEAMKIMNKSKKSVLLILADIKIQGTRTQEFVSQIKKINSKTRLIFMTDYQEKDSMLAGCDYIRKPFELRLLANKIRKALDN